ncbi:unnamed protein product [Scytosiphon promiscuus]
MKPLSHERAESIALTFTQNPTATRQMDIDDDDDNSCNNSGGRTTTAMLPIFGADSMREARLDPSILGSIVSSLDPDPPRAARNHNTRPLFNSDTDKNIRSTEINNASLAVNAHDTPATTRPPPSPGTKRQFSAVSRLDGEAAPAEEGPREWAGGGGGGGGGSGRVVGTAGTAGTRVGTAGQRAETAGRRRPRVRHGLRVLLRGASRCGKTTILWDYCHRAAMAGHRVVLVCLRVANDVEGLQVLPRSMRAGGSRGDGDELQGWEASALGRIGIKYVRSRDDLAWYLASLHTLKRAQWPTVIAVDDVDKIIEASAGGGGSGGGGSSGLGAAALRILALLQDTAEFFDNARAEAFAGACDHGTGGTVGTAVTAAAKTTAANDPTTTQTPSKITLTTPQAKEGGRGSDVDVGRGAGTSTPQQPLSGNLNVGFQDVEGEGGLVAEEGEARTTVTGPRGGRQGEAVAVRVVSTCSTSDRGTLALYGRFVHVVARVQNTTGPDCFSLKVEPGAGMASRFFSGPNARSPDGFAQGFTPWNGDRNSAKADTGVGDGRSAGADSPVARLEAVEFVRSQLDGSFALF